MLELRVFMDSLSVEDLSAAENAKEFWYSRGKDLPDLLEDAHRVFYEIYRDSESFVPIEPFADTRELFGYLRKVGSGTWFARVYSGHVLVATLNADRDQIEAAKSAAAKIFENWEEARGAAKVAAEKAAEVRGENAGEEYYVEEYGASGTGLLGYYVSLSDGQGFEEFEIERRRDSFVVIVRAFYEDPNPTYIQE